MPLGSPRLRTTDGKKNGVGVRLKQLRKSRNLTQDELCGQIALATNGEWVPDLKEISRIELGRRIVTDLEVTVLAKTLDSSPCFLLTGEPSVRQDVAITENKEGQ